MCMCMCVCLDAYFLHLLIHLLPFIDISRVASVYLNLSQENLQALLSPLNDWTNNYTDANMVKST